ncbi:hypothetical protein F5Y02DRAFT_8663 [Annulohypoxylon stygium]|nr:hypothetical protein F5Y02DRAFT_8663 [Annulohypoxylon stygium]
MFGRGNLEEAKALRDSFARARQGRGRARSNYTNTSQRGRGHGAGQPSAAQHGQQQRGGFHQQRGGFHQQGSAHHQYGSFSTNPGSFAPPQQPPQPNPQPRPRSNELLNFNRPLAYQSGQRQENMPPQQQQSTVPGSAHSPALTPAPAATSSFLFSTPTPTTFTTANSGRTANLPQIDEEGEKSQRASQKANEKRTQQARKASVAADDTDEITPARYGGLSASRWNTDEVSHSESSFMDIDEEEEEEEEQPDDTQDDSQQGGLAPPGRIVTSGMLRGPGLRSSRWNSRGHYR